MTHPQSSVADKLIGSLKQATPQQNQLPDQRSTRLLSYEIGLTGIAVFLIGFLPLVLYGFIYFGVPTVSAIEARQLLRSASDESLLVDIRSPETFDRLHVTGAQQWSFVDIMVVERREDLPESLTGRELLLLSDAGIQSAQAARHLQALSVPAKHIHGGMQAWIATATKEGAGNFTIQDVVISGGYTALKRQLTLAEQMVTVTASFLVKPVYMVGALLLIIILWRSRGADLRLLRWALIFFLVGEIACVFNTATFFAIGEQSDLFEYLHGLGMVLCLWLLVLALVEGVDQRLIHLSHPQRPCAFAPLCRACAKREDVPCRLEQVFKLLLPVIAVLALIPLTARPDATAYNGSLFGVPYNFAHPGIHQWYEILYLPLVTLGLLTITFFILLVNKEGAVLLARIPFSAGLGALLYSLLMLVLFGLYRENLVWFIFWEEGTELLLIAAIGALLWVFRRGFFSTGLPFRGA